MTLTFEPISNTSLLATASKLPRTGDLKQSGGLIYLDIDNGYILTLNPLLGSDIRLPEYFSDGGIGAHISVVYPEEGVKPLIDKKHSYHFSLSGLYKARFQDKTYYVLGVESAPLLQLRRVWGLSDKLSIENQLVGLHITIGVSD